MRNAKVGMRNAKVGKRKAKIGKRKAKCEKRNAKFRFWTMRMEPRRALLIAPFADAPNNDAAQNDDAAAQAACGQCGRLRGGECWRGGTRSNACGSRRRGWRGSRCCRRKI